MNIEMEKCIINEVELEYSILGKKEKEPIIFIHGGIIADANIPLFSEPSLKNYRLIHYRDLYTIVEEAMLEVVRISSVSLYPSRH